MSISWIGALLLVIILSMGAVGSNYQQATLWRKNQIVLDNTAIRMGQRDRAVFRKIRAVNEHISNLEKKHHVLHACARVPATAASCKPKDLVLEIQIQSLLLSASSQAQLEWRKNSLSNHFEKKRPGLVLTKKNCMICFKPNRLEPVEKHLATHLYLKNAPRDLESGYTVTFSEKPDYKLVEGSQ